MELREGQLRNLVTVLLWPQIMAIPLKEVPELLKEVAARSTVSVSDIVDFLSVTGEIEKRTMVGLIKTVMEISKKG